MALFFKRLSPSSASVAFLIILGISIHGPQCPVAAEDQAEDKLSELQFIKHPDKRFESLQSPIVYPALGLSTGPPVYDGDSSFLDPTRDLPAQKVNLTGAQGDDTENVDDIENIEQAGETQTHKNRLEKISATNPLPFREGCFSGDASEDDPDHPDVDTVELYDALDHILEHVTSVDLAINDPEEIRMRAYVGERHSSSAGLQVILHEPTYFWGNGGALGGEEEFDSPEEMDVEEFSAESLGDADIDPGLLQRQPHDADQEASDAELIDDVNTSAKIDVKEGSKLRLVCNVTGLPSYRVEWQRGANLSFPGGASIIGGRSVLLDYVGREDAGTYICTATMPSGHSHSSGVSIRVQYPPVVGLWSRDTEANSVELGCLVEGRPRPTMAWYVNNTKISMDNCPRNTEIRSSVLSQNFVLSVLTLTNITVEDFGYYHCRASSSVGVSRGYVMLHDDSGVLDVQELADQKPMIHPGPLENPRLSSFLLGMVPPLYIGLYIIAYLGCYKTSISGVGGHGRFGAGVDLMEE